MRGISMQELFAGKAIYQPGTPRKASKCSCNLSELQLVSTGRHATTLNQLLQCGIPYNIMLGSVRLTDQVIEHHAIMSQQKCLVNSGDYIELGTPQCDMLYGILLAVFKLQDGAVVCLIQGFQKLQSQDGARPFVNDCRFEETQTIKNVERQEITRTKLTFEHDWSNTCIPTMFIVYFDTSRVLESTAKYSEYYYQLHDTAKQRYKYISLINLLKASLVYGHIVRGDRCLKDYGFRLSQARVDSAESAPTSPSLEVTLS
eukprot:Em0080g15a